MQDFILTLTELSPDDVTINGSNCNVCIPVTLLICASLICDIKRLSSKFHIAMCPRLLPLTIIGLPS